MTTMKRNVAIFDLDHTITRYDTFVRYLIGFILRHPSVIIKNFNLFFAAILFKLGFKDNHWLKALVYRSLFSGRPTKEVDLWNSKFEKNVLTDGLRQKAFEKISFHKNRGDRVVLVTASFEFYVQRIADQLGFETLIGTKVEINSDGIFGDSIIGGNCYGRAKVERLKNIFGDDHSDYHIIAYSDHHSDMPLLEWADEGIAVNPTKNLKEKAVTSGFPIEDWN
jgi:phosphatidylglycerophosphatase C